MYPNLSCPSTSPLQSLSSIDSYSSREHHSTQDRGLRQGKVVSDNYMPFGLRMLSMSPREILEKKAKMKMKGQTGMELEEVEDFDKVDVEKEIQVKLPWNDSQTKGREEKCTQSEEAVASLLLTIKDMEDKKEQALRLIWLEEEQEKLMKVQLEEARKDLTDLRMLAASNKEVQARTESLLQARMVTLQTELAHSKARHNKPTVPGVTGQATSCTTLAPSPPVPWQVRWTCFAWGSRGASGSWAGWWRGSRRRGV